MDFLRMEVLWCRFFHLTHVGLCQLSAESFSCPRQCLADASTVQILGSTPFKAGFLCGHFEPPQNTSYHKQPEQENTTRNEVCFQQQNAKIFFAKDIVHTECPNKQQRLVSLSNLSFKLRSFVSLVSHSCSVAF